MKKFFAILGMLALGGIAVVSGILFYQLRSQRISPVTPEQPSAVAEGIIWNEAIDCNGGHVSISTIPDWQSILRVAEVTPSQWTWGADTTKTVQGQIGWLFPGDTEVFEERPSKTYTKPVNCGAAISLPTATPLATVKASVTPTPTPIAQLMQQQQLQSSTATPSPTSAPTQPPSLGGTVVTPTPTATPNSQLALSATPTPSTLTQTGTGETTTTTTTTSAVGGGTSATPFPIPVTGGEVPTILAIGGGIMFLIIAVFAFAI